RLAQMRGKKVIVVGPDLVAAVLREMADEFIAYRSLVGGADAHSSVVRAEAAELGRRRRRGGRGGRGRAGDAEPEAESPTQAAEPTTPRAPRPIHRERRFVDRAGVFRAEPPAEPTDEPALPPAEEVPTPQALVEP